MMERNNQCKLTKNKVQSYPLDHTIRSDSKKLSHWWGSFLSPNAMLYIVTIRNSGEYP